jgi:hypothetical protein
LTSLPRWERILAHVFPTAARNGQRGHDGANPIEGEQDDLDKSPEENGRRKPGVQTAGIKR